MTIEIDAPEVFDPAIPPGGWVCGTCGMPTEAEPCAQHQPNAWKSLNGLCLVTVQPAGEDPQICGLDLPCPDHDCVCAHCGYDVERDPCQGLVWVHRGTRSRRCAGADVRTDVEPVLTWGW